MMGRGSEVQGCEVQGCEVQGCELQGSEVQRFKVQRFGASPPASTPHAGFCAAGQKNGRSNRKRDFPNQQCIIDCGSGFQPRLKLSGIFIINLVSYSRRRWPAADSIVVKQP